ncbi:MAG: OmpA family protein [Acidobacteria bacterium]|nr:OmpA family protein [Acidobacteriota bacterium]
MKNRGVVRTAFLLGFVVFASIAISAQADIARSVTAITFPLDETITVQFRGTTQYPRVHGEAEVRRTSRTGTQVKLSVEKLPRPFELGTGYTTYIAWAISPEGQVDRLGEFKRSGLGFIDSKMTATTPLQTFAIIVTAEPHFLVERPSQKILLDSLDPVSSNGQRVATKTATYYFGNSSDYFRDPRTPDLAEIDYAKTPPTILQARQAIALARFAGADRDAATELNDAVVLSQNAENAWQAGRDKDSVDITARQAVAAAVKAENLAKERKDARDKRNEKIRSDAEIRAAENKFSDAQQQIDSLKEEVARETRNRELAERDVLNYSNQVKDLREENGKLRDDNARLRLDLDNATKKLADMELQQKAVQEANDKELKAAKIKAAEGELLNSLHAYGTVVKNERGIVLTLPESFWSGPRTATLMPQSDGKLTAIAELLVNNPDYRISVESHTDNQGDPTQIQSLTDKRSYAIADKLSSLGVQEGRIVAKGFGASVPVAPNTTVVNRAKNRRVQLILTLPVGN